MTTDVQTIAAPQTNIGIEQPKRGVIPAITPAAQTIIAEFSKISHLLSDKVLRRPRTFSNPTSDELRQIAKDNPPPPEWYEGEAERPF
jgi:hypothetical protein